MPFPVSFINKSLIIFMNIILENIINYVYNVRKQDNAYSIILKKQTISGDCFRISRCGGKKQYGRKHISVRNKE